MSERFNALEGMSCVPADGAMYLLPKIEIPKRAVEEAEKRGKKADVMYTLDLLGESFVISRA
jgi:alanine transaminase